MISFIPKEILFAFFLFVSLNDYGQPQVLRNNGAVINIVGGTVVSGDNLVNTTGTIINVGTVSLTAGYNNSATVNGAGNYNIGGDWVNSGTFTAGTGTVSFNGTQAQTIGATDFSNVTFAGGNTKNINGNISLSGALTLSDSATLALGANNITLLSSVSATARIAQVATTASISYGTGKFIIQRYIPGRRKYRLITSPVTTSTSTTLTAGQESLSIWGNWQNQGGTTANIGTYITGGTAANGFDQQVTNASLYTYDDVNRKYIGFTTANSKNTKYTPLKAGICYYMFVYGDRTNTAYTTTPNYTVLTETGTILTGDQTYSSSSTIPLTNVTGRYTMLGNPFASPIDWATITKTNLYNTYWGWDPNLSSTGGYITVSTAGTVTLISPYTGTTGLNQYIQSGQGFFVRTSATSPVLVIKESDKVSNNNTNAFRTTTNSIPLIAINLYDDNKLFLDGTLTAFSNSFLNEVNNQDASKMFGSGEGISIGIGNELLSLDARQMPLANDTIFLKVAKLTKPRYILQIFTDKLEGKIQPYLYDTYLQTTVALSTTDTNRIAFNITGDVASANADRFRIIFSASTISPVIIPVNPQLAVFPNPIKNQQINFKINDLEKGIYSVFLINSLGQKIIKKSIIHQGGTLSQTLVPDKILSSGTYYLDVKSTNTKFTKTIFIE